MRARLQKLRWPHRDCRQTCSSNSRTGCASSLSSRGPSHRNEALVVPVATTYIGHDDPALHRREETNVIAIPPDDRILYYYRDREAFGFLSYSIRARSRSTAQAGRLSNTSIRHRNRQATPPHPRHEKRLSAPPDTKAPARERLMLRTERRPVRARRLSFSAGPEDSTDPQRRTTPVHTQLGLLSPYWSFRTPASRDGTVSRRDGPRAGRSHPVAAWRSPVEWYCRRSGPGILSCLPSVANLISPKCRGAHATCGSS